MNSLVGNRWHDCVSIQVPEQWQNAHQSTFFALVPYWTNNFRFWIVLMVFFARLLLDSCMPDDMFCVDIENIRKLWKGSMVDVILDLFFSSFLVWLDIVQFHNEIGMLHSIIAWNLLRKPLMDVIVYSSRGKISLTFCDSSSFEGVTLKRFLKAANISAMFVYNFRANLAC